MKKVFCTFFRICSNRMEIFFWLAALAALFFLPVHRSATSLCIFSLLGFGHCPGCGIGHAMHYAMHLQFARSFQEHPLGIFGVMIIFMRIKQLFLYKTPAYEAQSY